MRDKTDGDSTDVFIGDFRLTVLKAVDYQKNGHSFKDIRQKFYLTDEESTYLKRSLRAQGNELTQCHTEEIRRFTEDLLFQLRGTHTPSWNERTAGVTMVLVGLSMLYIAALVSTNLLVFLLFTGLGIGISVSGCAKVYKEAWRHYEFQERALHAIAAPKQAPLSIPYTSIMRLKIRIDGKNIRTLLIQDKAERWYALLCTHSMQGIFRQMEASGRYDRGLHYEFPGEAFFRERRA